MGARTQSLPATTILATTFLAGGCALVVQATSLPNNQGTSGQRQMVTLWITALDRKRDPVPGLRKEDFRLYEDKVEKPIVDLSESGAEPLRLGLLIDASLKHRVPFFRPRLGGCAALLRPVLRSGGTAFVATFGNNLDIGPQTSDPAIFEGMLIRTRGTWRGARTTLFDSITALCQNPLLLPEGRKALVVVSDADDTVSKNRLRDAVRYVELRQTQVYFLVTVPDALERGFERNHRMVDARDSALTLSRETGGEAFRVHTDGEVDAALEQIAVRLGSQYGVKFYPTAPGEHKITMVGGRRGVTIVHQKELFVPKN